jgi:predicted metalloprotease
MRWRAPLLLLLLILAIPLLLLGCGSDGGGDDGSTSSEEAQVPIQAQPAGAGEVLGEVGVAQEEEVEAARRARVEKVLDDAAGLEPVLNDFWERELARLYGIRFDPPDYFAYYRSVEGSDCAGERLGANNAFYCPSDLEEGVLFDIDWFQQYLEAHPGGATTFLILAHEWGHAVQDSWVESGGTDHWVTPNMELNADCLAGVFLSRSIEEGTIIEETGDAEAIFNWLYEAGSSPWTTPGDHGTREQRETAFTVGAERGTDYCRTVY